jgi:hypothetical protein
MYHYECQLHRELKLNQDPRRNVMSNYEQQILATAQYYDAAMQAAEAEGIEILSSIVPGSRVHQVINNPIDSGIDEG